MGDSAIVNCAIAVSVLVGGGQQREVGLPSPEKTRTQMVSWAEGQSCVHVVGGVCRSKAMVRIIWNRLLPHEVKQTWRLYLLSPQEEEVL